MGVGGQGHAPSALPPRKRPGTHCTGGWVGPRAGLYQKEGTLSFFWKISPDWWPPKGSTVHSRSCKHFESSLRLTNIHKGHCAGNRRVPCTVSPCVCVCVCACWWMERKLQFMTVGGGRGGVQTRNWRRNVVTGHPVCRIYGRFHLPARSEVIIEDWKARQPNCLIPSTIPRCGMRRWRAGEKCLAPTTQNRASEIFTMTKQGVLKAA